MERADSIVVFGHSWPVALAFGRGGVRATSHDWNITRTGHTPCGALRALAEALEDRIIHALAKGHILAA